MRTFCRCALLLCLSFISIHLYAQNAAITGEVQDASGAVIRGAEIRIVEQSQGTTRTVHTNETGSYNAPFLNPGPYRIYVQSPNFSTAVSDPIILTVGQTFVFNVHLKVGSAQQEITVDAGSQILNTTDASVSTVIDRKFVENIPLNGRSFQDLISMTPGVVTQTPQAGGTVANGGDFSVNGQRTESNYYLVDGVSGNISPGDGGGVSSPSQSGSLGASTALGTTQNLISVDALQEFRVLSSTYSAEYGRTPGGQFSLVSRSGTNVSHGTVFDYLRNNFFDANDWFNDQNNKAQPPLRQNDFGGTFGGVVWIPKLYNGKNRTFFFVSYEGLRLTQPQAATIQYVPDTFMRQQAPVALQPILNAFPLQNGTDYGTQSSPSLAQFIEPYSLPGQIDATSVRIDHIFSSKLSMFIRGADTPSFTSSRSSSAVGKTTVNSQSYTMGTTFQLSNRATNEFRLGYARGDSSSKSSLDAFGGATPTNYAAAMGVGTAASPVLVTEIYLSGIGAALLEQLGSANHERQWNIVDNFSISRGAHQIKLGMDYRRIESPTNPATPLVEGLFFSASSVLSNSSTELVLENNIPTTPVFNETAVFIQDEWHIKPRLNLSIGLRWEVDPPPTDAHGNDPYTLQGSLSVPSSLVLAPRGTPLWNTSWYNFAPRLGAAWQAHITPGWETVVRFGGGVFFDTDNEEAVDAFRGIGTLATSILLNAPLPATPAQLDFSPSVVPPYTSGTVYAFPSHLQLPYTLGWNTSLEQALGKTQALTISYVGSNGRRLIDMQQLSLTALNPNFGTIEYFKNGATSNYQALQVQFQRSVSRGIHALGSYTWSHSIDFGSNDSALPIVRGNSDFDVRSNFQGGISWDLGTKVGNKITSALLGNWGIDARVMARTGFPITLQGNILTDPTTGDQYYGGLNINPGQPIYTYQSGCGNGIPCVPGGRVINKAAFSLPTTNESGDAPRNFVRGFGAAQANLAARREFQLHERVALQFRAEAFNILNHPNFGYVDPTYTDATFGQATKMLNSSLGTVASQYQQGGPRSMQFALKLMF